jgi:beta-galactosidase/beta-glucuronidase
MRKIERQKDAKGFMRIQLNGRELYNLGVLDQGFWPDGLYTAPTDAALQFDVEMIKSLGFNTIRKHAKVEPARWYYHCDQLGVMVWQDMVPPATDSAGQTSQRARSEFEAEAHETLTQLHNHPSITTWVLFNEGWGAYDQTRLEQWIKGLDPSRLLDGHSGSTMMVKGQWVSTVAMAGPASDYVDIHSYPAPAVLDDAGKARVLGEYGGIGVVTEGHVWKGAEPGWGYVQMTPEALAQTYGELIDKLKVLRSESGLSASIYTQTFDVETELNGLMTYDREIIKIPRDELVEIHKRLRD